jgi:hypothetical protein
MIDELIDIVKDPEVEPRTKVMAVNALLKGDQVEYEKDHPRQADHAEVGAKAQDNGTGVVAGLTELFARVDEQLRAAGPPTKSKASRSLPLGLKELPQGDGGGPGQRPADG